MAKEKQIEEIYQEILTAGREFLKKPVLNVEKYVAEHLYNADYRKERQGKWIRSGMNTPKCSLCHQYSYDFGNYCPNCGAKMKGAE